MTVSVSPEDPTPLQDTLQLEAGSWKVEIPVQVSALPGKVTFGAASIDFGKVTAGRDAEAAVTLENSGGIPAIVSVKVNAPFEVGAAGVQVPARGGMKVPVFLRGVQAGRYSGTFTMEVEGAAAKLPITAEVIDSAPRPTSSGPLAVTTERPAAPPTTPSPDIPAVPSTRPTPAGKVELGHGLPPLLASDLPSRTGLYTSAITSDSAVLEWPSTLGAGTSLSVQEQQLSVGANGALVQNWVPLKSVSFSENPGKRRAQLEDLQSGRLYVVRVASNGAGIFATKFYTLPKEPFINWRKVVIGLLLAGVAAFGWWKWKNRARGAW
jgi:hypothetical protein